MASSNKTPHYGLSQFAPTDKPAWQGDYNADMKKIDNGIYAAQNKADSLDASVSEAENKAAQALEKAEAAEDAAENAAALAQEAKTTADNISGDLSGKVNKAGDTMTGPLVLPGDPTEDNQAATKKYVDEHSGGGPSGDYLPLSGGTLTGPLTLAADPSTAMQAATKQYADKMLPLAGGTMTGNLILNGDPTQDNGAATKKYVDNAVAGAAGGTVSTPTKHILNASMLTTAPLNFTVELASGVMLINGSLVYVGFTVTTSSAVVIKEGTLNNPNFIITLPFKIDTPATSAINSQYAKVSSIPISTTPENVTSNVDGDVFLYNEGEAGKIAINFNTKETGGSLTFNAHESITIQTFGFLYN